MSLLTLTGALAFVSIAAIWASVKLTKWDIQAEKGVDQAAAVRIWSYFVAAVLLVELGPPVANALVQAVSALL